MEDQGETDKAMMLYMKASKPGKAARLALRNNYILQDEDTVAKLKKMLVKQGESFQYPAHAPNMVTYVFFFDFISHPQSYSNWPAIY